MKTAHVYVFPRTTSHLAAIHVFSNCRLARSPGLLARSRRYGHAQKVWRHTRFLPLLRGLLMADRIIELYEANKTTELCDVADEIPFEEVE